MEQDSLIKVQVGSTRLDFMVDNFSSN